MIYKILKIISEVFSYIIPIRKDLFVFNSFPSFSDNPYAVYKTIKARGIRCKCVWLYNDVNTSVPNEIDYAYHRFSIRAFWYLYRAKYIICSHGVNSFLSYRQNNKVINLWHGMPIKKIGSLDPAFNGIMRTKADFLVVSSDEFQRIMSASFNNMELDRVLVLGQPRNDLLYEPTEFFNIHGIDRSRYDKIGIWLPTYKKSYIGDVREDGNYIPDGISFLTIADLENLNTKLKNLNHLIIIKIHPMDILQKSNIPSFSNLVIIKQDDLKCQLYPLLGNCDYLLTDYSSVWVDYEILHRPIGFVMNDIQQYKQSRGFNFDNMLEILPGPILDNLDKIIDFCSNANSFIIETGHRFNKYKDNKSSERLLNYFGI